MNKQNTKERGAVSIFIVIFTALLVTVVTTGFIQIMLRNQNQATNNDLSQSAYDSAMAGVEDAKRALVRMKECEQTGAACADTIYNALRTQECQSLGTDGGAGVVTFNDDGEVPVGSGLNQAYTCVKVSTQTEYIEDSLDENETSVKLLKGVEEFKAIRISWFQSKDSENNALPTYDASSLLLPKKDDWPETQPPIMRVQFIQTARSGINLGEFNQTGTTATNSARTLFLYPDARSDTELDFDDDTRRSDGNRNQPKIVSCNPSYDKYATYACSTTIILPDSFRWGSMNGYLQLKPIYGATSYRVNLLDDDSDVVRFDGVQPQVDSTGRASDLFRRVQANISVSESGSEVPFPDAALIVNGNLCKSFFVTNDDNHYKQLGDCDPALPSAEPDPAP